MRLLSHLLLQGRALSSLWIVLVLNVASFVGQLGVRLVMVVAFHLYTFRFKENSLHRIACIACSFCDRRGDGAPPHPATAAAASRWNHRAKTVVFGCRWLAVLCCERRYRQ